MSTTPSKQDDMDAESYRIPMTVTRLQEYKSTAYYICPRCEMTLEWDFMRYCDRCGQ